MQFLWRDKRPPSWARAAVALHGHTHHSRESLRFLSSYGESIPGVTLLLRLAAWQHRRLTGETFRAERAFWRPPLSAAESFQLESRQIAALGLRPVISLTDHDEIQACFEVPDAPISLEWTVPFGPTLFHLGIHNLPRHRARQWHAELLAYTNRPDARRLGDLLVALNRLEDVLIVLNHPYWDGGRVGADSHALAVGVFLTRFGPFLHALEVNGLRTARENERVLRLAQSCGLPVVAGGDRHGREPSTCLNLTGACSFGEFVAEVRRLRRSYIVFTAAYRASTRWRWLRTGHEIVRMRAGVRGEDAHWLDHFYYRFEDGREVSLRECWGRRSAFYFSPCLTLLKLAALPGARMLAQWMLADGGEFVCPTTPQSSLAQV